MNRSGSISPARAAFLPQPMAPRWRLVPVALAFGLAACAQDQGPGLCERTQTTSELQVMLFFGRAIPGGGDLSDVQWADFLRDVVTPSLPDGFTTWGANGQWWSPNGVIVREATKVVLAGIQDRPDRLDAITHIRQAYASRFHQQVVGMTLTPVCAAF